jgi:ATP-binding cassette subfamily F protein 3
MIQLSSVTKSFGDRVLFQDVTWQVSDRERVGLCGPNGAGKTTLLRIFANLDEADSGAVIKPSDMRIGYLPQDGLTHEGLTLHAEAGLAFQWLLDVRTDMETIEGRLGDADVPEGEHEAMLHRYSDLQDRFRLHDGYAIDLKIDTVLRGLGFSPSDYERPTATFSGGWQMRRRTISISMRATGSKSTSTTTLTPSSSSRTIASSSMRWWIGSRTSTCGR